MGSPKISKTLLKLKQSEVRGVFLENQRLSIECGMKG